MNSLIIDSLQSEESKLLYAISLMFKLNKITQSQRWALKDLLFQHNQTLYEALNYFKQDKNLPCFLDRLQECLPNAGQNYYLDDNLSVSSVSSFKNRRPTQLKFQNKLKSSGPLRARGSKISNGKQLTEETSLDQSSSSFNFIIKQK